jgi:hypothetical protein
MRLWDLWRRPPETPTEVLGRIAHDAVDVLRDEVYGPWSTDERTHLEHRGRVAGAALAFGSFALGAGLGLYVVLKRR